MEASHLVFQDRDEAGRRLAKKLADFHGTDAIILAIPRGGVPVAAAAAHRLELQWNVTVARKLPVPWNPEAGFGAVAADGTMVLNEPMVSGLQLRSSRINDIAQEVSAEVARRTDTYSSGRPPPIVSGRTVIVLDDGLASGYTMLAAIKSLRARSPAQVVAASPVASRAAARMIEAAADRCVFEFVSPAVPFAVADFYLAWRDLTDDDIMPLLRCREGSSSRTDST